MVKAFFFMPVNYLSYIAILFWSNLFIIMSRFYGVTATIRAINWLGRMLPLKTKLLDTVSDRADILYQRFPFLFVARRQKCLIRGFLLFFFGKRMGVDICLRFGCQLENSLLKTHCWILENNIIRYEVDEVVKEYVTLIDYT